MQLILRLTSFVIAFTAWVGQICVVGSPPPPLFAYFFLLDTVASMCFFILLARSAVLEQVSTSSLGYFGAFTTILLSVAPQLGSLLSTGTLLRQPISLNICWASILCSSLWAAYSLCIGNNFMLIPNLAVVCIQVLPFCLPPTPPPPRPKKVKVTEEVQPPAGGPEFTTTTTTSHRAHVD